MKLLAYLSNKKQTVHSVLLLVQVFSPIVMFIGIRNQLIFLVIFSLTAILLANLTATLTK